MRVRGDAKHSDEVCCQTDLQVMYVDHGICLEVVVNPGLVTAS